MTFPFNELGAITHDLILDQVTLGSFSEEELWNRFVSKKELESGGKKINAPLSAVDESGTPGNFYTKGSVLSLQKYEGISASQHSWRYFQEPIVIDKTDIAENMDKHGQLKLVASKVKVGKAAMVQKLSKAILSDGSVTSQNNDDDQFDGFEAIVAASGSYGGISSTDLATWASTVTGSVGTLTKAILDASYDATYFAGQGGATMGVSTVAVFTIIKGLLQAAQRTMRENSLSGLGNKGQSLVYNGIDYFTNRDVLAGYLYHIDENHCKLHVHKDHFMRVQKITDLETADAILERIFLYGNIVASERKYHSKLTGITA